MNYKLENQPFKLSPSGKDYLWGGNRLNDEFQKNIDLSPLAETWECSTHPDGPSYIASGKYIGKTLKEVLEMHPEYLGTHPDSGNELPILIKLIDADKDLSVQVHPDDEYAKVYEKGQLGKTEFWYVLDAIKGASLVYGLSHNCDKDRLRQYIDKGELDNHLNYVEVQKNDLFFIKSGTIHALGAGTLVAEIQQNSNLTYRLYDYDRVDKDGNKRELHVDKALQVANLNSMAEPRQPVRVMKYANGVAKEVLCRCKYFEVQRMLINTKNVELKEKKIQDTELSGTELREKKIQNTELKDTDDKDNLSKVKFSSDELSFRVLLCVDGEGTISYADNEMNVKKGECIFVPADSTEIYISGRMQLLDVRC